MGEVMRKLNIDAENPFTQPPTSWYTNNQILSKPYTKICKLCRVEGGGNFATSFNAPFHKIMGLNLGRLPSFDNFEERGSVPFSFNSKMHFFGGLKFLRILQGVLTAKHFVFYFWSIRTSLKLKMKTWKTHFKKIDDWILSTKQIHIVWGEIQIDTLPVDTFYGWIWKQRIDLTHETIKLMISRDKTISLVWQLYLN